MKVQVTKGFVDKNNPSVMYMPGQILDFEEDRAKNCEKLGYAEIIEEEVPKAIPVKKPAPVKKSTKTTTKK